MANIPITTATSGTAYLSASGAGTDGDPYISAHLESNSADILTAEQAIQAAVEGSLTVDATGQGDVPVTLDGESVTVAGSVGVTSVTIPTAIYHGKTAVTTAGTEVTLASSQAILSGVTVKALAANTGLIYVGVNGVSSADGFQLSPKESIFIEVANLTTVWIDSAVNGEGVSYIAS